MPVRTSDFALVIGPDHWGIMEAQELILKKQPLPMTIPFYRRRDRQNPEGITSNYGSLEILSSTERISSGQEGGVITAQITDLRE